MNNLIDKFYNSNKLDLSDFDETLINKDNIIENILNKSNKNNVVNMILQDNSLLDVYDKLKLFNVFDYILSDKELYANILFKLFRENQAELKKRLLRKTSLMETIPCSNIYCFDYMCVILSYAFISTELVLNIGDYKDKAGNNPLSSVFLTNIWEYYCNTFEKNIIIKLLDDGNLYETFNYDKFITNNNLKSKCTKTNVGSFRIFTTKDNIHEYEIITKKNI